MNQTAKDYQIDIDEWAQKNFPYQDRIGLGMCEELGEYCKAILKSNQKIRGYHASKIKLDKKDALADTLIFLLHYAECNRTFLTFYEAESEMATLGSEGEFAILAVIYQNLSSILRLSDPGYRSHRSKEDQEAAPRVHGQRLMNALFALAWNQGFKDPVRDIIEPTWREVKKRDWKKFPKDGLTS